MSSHYCKYCNVEHPRTPEFWSFQRGGKHILHCRVKARERNNSTYHKNIEDSRKYQREWARDNQTKRQSYKKFRYSTDIEYRIAENLRTRLRAALKGKLKSGSAVNDLGCSLADLRKHLEEQFSPEMNWQNHGTVWHIDHILPLANYQLSDRGTLRRLVHYTNLQPLLVLDNLTKGNRE